MVLLPIKLIKFWYPDSLAIFIRTWSNTINLLEEDLAVGLMLKLLFTPLFHDSSIFGRIMSFGFRITRIFIGLIAFVLTTLLILTLATVWFLLPILALAPSFSAISITLKALLIFGLGIFGYRQLNNKPKAIEKDVNWIDLLNTSEVKKLLWNLEINGEFLKGFNPGWSDNILPIKAGPDYLFVALLQSIPGIENELLKVNLSIADFDKVLEFLEYKRGKNRAVYIWDEEFAVAHLKGVNRGWLSAPTPNLDNISEDLTREAAKSKQVDFIGRSSIISEIVNVLSQEKDRNVILVGPPGSGKSALVSFLAKKIVSGDAPPSLATKRLVKLDLTGLLSGVKDEAGLAERVKNVFEEVKFVQDIIVFVDEIHDLGLGEAGHEFNLYGLMLPYLESSDFQFIGATESENYVKTLEKNGAFARIFTKIEIPPASPDETREILKSYALEFEKTGVGVSYKAIESLVDLSAKFIHDRVLPDSAIGLLNEAKVLAKNNEIISSVVKDVVGKRVNVPVVEVGNVEKGKLLNLENEIHQKFVGQEEAVKAVADTLRRAAVSLREGTRPIGSFLFVGPTGVGKTELAKTLSQVYFKTSAAFLRFDMSEYQTPDSVSRLIGDAQNPGGLTEAVRNKPYALILLDEFEKASPQILTLFLQVLEDGRLTDSSGKHIDFTNTIIIATSNAASLVIAQGLEQGENFENLSKIVKEELLKTFKPELINRFDEVVIFKPLKTQELEKIVQNKLIELAGMLKEKGYLVEFSSELISELAKRGFDPVLGARPLRRLIQDTLEAKLSTMILENKLPKGQPLQIGTEVFSS